MSSNPVQLEMDEMIEYISEIDRRQVIDDKISCQ